MTTNVQNIPGNLLVVIRDCIEQEEGGWKLTSNPNDPDGGWTYAGVTRKLYEAWCKKNNLKSLSLAELKEILKEQEFALDAAEFKDYILCIYWDEFLEPITEICGNLFTYHYGLFLSCAVNRGMAEFKRCYAEAHNAGTFSTPKFIAAWQDGYTKLVANNADAWEAYCDALLAVAEGRLELSSVKKPGSKRWKFLAGWINRTQRWM